MVVCIIFLLFLSFLLPHLAETLICIEVCIYIPCQMLGSSSFIKHPALHPNKDKVRFANKMGTCLQPSARKQRTISCVTHVVRTAAILGSHAPMGQRHVRTGDGRTTHLSHIQTGALPMKVCGDKSPFELCFFSI